MVKKNYMENRDKNREYLIKNLREVMEKEEDILFGYLYGSYVSGPLLPDSDIDIAIYLKPNDLKKYLEIEKRLLSTLIDRIHSDRIDLKILNMLPLIHQYYVLKGGIPIFIKDEKARVDFDTRVMLRFFELKPYLDEYKDMLFSRIKKGD